MDKQALNMLSRYVSMLAGRFLRWSIVIFVGPGAFCLRCLIVNLSSDKEMGGKRGVSRFMSERENGLMRGEFVSINCSTSWRLVWSKSELVSSFWKIVCQCLRKWSSFSGWVSSLLL